MKNRNPGHLWNNRSSFQRDKGGGLSDRRQIHNWTVVGLDIPLDDRADSASLLPPRSHIDADSLPGIELGSLYSDLNYRPLERLGQPIPVNISQLVLSIANYPQIRPFNQSTNGIQGIAQAIAQ